MISILNCNDCSLAEVGPKKILDLMNVPGLTRENVASHLQVWQISCSNSNIFYVIFPYKLDLMLIADEL